MTRGPELTQREVLGFVLRDRRRGDPYGLYERLRAAGPVQNSALGVTTVCSLDAAVDILRDPTMSSNPFSADFGYRAGRRGAGIAREAAGRLVLRRVSRPDGSQRPLAVLQRHLPNRMDPPVHGRVRGIASAAFTPELVHRAAPEVERIAHHLIDSFESSGRVELLSRYAYELPLVVICNLLGVPGADHDSFRTWASELIPAFDLHGFGSEQVRRRADLATVAMRAYLAAGATQRRAEPRDDLLSQLVVPDPDGRVLSPDELTGTVAVILAAGRETTANLIGNGVWALHKNLAQRQRFVDEPHLGRSAVEELLRFESPIQLVQRISTVEREHDGVLIPAGRQVVVLLGAANRDPVHFRDPARLDIARSGTRPVSFGYGTHHCFGASLATTVGLVGLRVLYERLPGTRPVINSARWRSSRVFRGLERLPVTW